MDPAFIVGPLQSVLPHPRRVIGNRWVLNTNSDVLETEGPWVAHGAINGGPHCE